MMGTSLIMDLKLLGRKHSKTFNSSTYVKVLYKHCHWYGCPIGIISSFLMKVSVSIAVNITVNSNR